MIRRHEVDYPRAIFTTFEEYIYTDETGEETRFQKEHPYAITSFPELEYLLREAGIDQIQTFGSYAAKEAEPAGGWRMIIIAS